MTSKFKVVVLLMLVLSLLGCGKSKEEQQPAKQKMQLDAQLLKVDMDLAMLELDLRTNQTVECMLSTSMKNLESKNKLVDEMKASAENECTIAGALVEATRETFNKLKIEGSVSSPLYLFSIYKNDSEGSKEERAGVFASIEQCTELERQAHELGMPTSKCVEWRSLLKPMGDVR